MNLFLKVLAEGNVGGVPPEAGAMGIVGPQMIIMLLVFVAFYFFLIMPQRKRDKKTKEMIAAIIVGDDIVTIGGIYGKVTAVKDDCVIIESGNGVDKGKLKVAKWAIKECLTIHG